MDSPSPHILVLPFPIQGHIMPLMEVAHHLIDAGITVTFLNTEFSHRRLLHAAAGRFNGDSDSGAYSSTTNRLRLLAIPDGLNSDEERRDFVRTFQAIPSGMEAGLKKVIRNSGDEGRPVKWIVADQTMAWALPVASSMGLRTAVFWPASAAMLAMTLNIAEMIKIGFIDEEGLPKKHEMFQLAPGIPALHSTKLAWNVTGISAAQSPIFPFILSNNGATADHAEFIICNTFMDLEPQALSLLCSAVPIGPLQSSDHHPAGHLWPPESSSAILKWLDSHSPGSVIYVAFGSHTIFSEAQIEELSYGLESTGRPFLWAIRPDLTSVGREKILSPEFLERVEGRALVVGWAPQQQLLAHPSVGCFMSHCGWNSTLEGLRNGVTFLCWPYFTDQFLNQSYICDTWKIGLSVDLNRNDAGGESGEVTLLMREEIRKRVEEVMEDDEMRKRALMWKEKAILSVNTNGTSYVNFKKVWELMKK